VILGEKEHPALEGGLPYIQKRWEQQTRRRNVEWILVFGKGRGGEENAGMTNVDNRRSPAGPYFGEEKSGETES